MLNFDRVVKTLDASKNFSTGGAGYIGSHACLELLENGYDVIVIDNLCNSSLESIKRVEKLSGKKIAFIEENIQSKSGINQVFNQNKIDAVIHFAGLKAVGESVIKPMTYYQNNVGTLNLLQIMQHNNVKILSLAHQQQFMDSLKLYQLRKIS